MTYIFIFLGEFGYELFNWQGVVRRFHRNVAQQARIIVASRAHLQAFYEHADAYVEISDVAAYQESRAMAYFALPTASSSWDSIAARRFDKALKSELKAFIVTQLGNTNPDVDVASCRFIFSSDYQQIGGLEFGRPRRSVAGVITSTFVEAVRSLLPGAATHLEQIKHNLYQNRSELNHNRKASIYEWLDADNNLYRCIPPDLAVAAQVAEKLGWPLTEPFVLCQTRHRDTSPRSPDQLPVVELEALLSRLSQQTKVVLLSFNTGRAMDSYSRFSHSDNFYTFPCSGFAEQSVLVHHAAQCLFFTEGDFGSHIYIPPFMGKDVIAIAPRSVYDLGTTPIDFWNANVFRFGGQIIPLMAEDVLADDATAAALADTILAGFGAPVATETTVTKD